MQGKAQVVVQRGTSRMDSDRISEVRFCPLIMFLSIVYTADAIPCVVVAIVHTKRLSISFHRRGEVLLHCKLMSTKCVGIRTAGIHRKRPPKESQRRVWISLKRKAVTHDTPSCCTGLVDSHTLMGQICQCLLVFSMPQNCRVVLYQTIQFGLICSDRTIKKSLTNFVVPKLQVASCHERKNVSCPGYIIRETIQEFESLSAVVSV
mmetsp:Transcript_14503/g.29654  ORF Transcript_14503/g.29654 Transcript_14503/m.29654 type:complete len:206 (-) Transcript_14503:1209-1826(-)